MITDQISAQSVGTIDLYDFDPIHSRAGIGILIDSEYRRQNIGFQSLTLMEEYALHVLHLHQLYAFIPKKNEASYRLFLKSGFKVSGTLQDWLNTENGFEAVECMQKILPSCLM